MQLMQKNHGLTVIKMQKSKEKASCLYDNST